MRKLYTLVFVRDSDRILLGYKKRGFGEGKWNGFGGKVQPGESIVAAAIRELNEECSLVVDEDKLTKIGKLSFEFLDKPDPIMEVHVFTSDVFQGEPKESDEMLPKWFEISGIPFSEMWIDDSLWFPIFLAGKKFTGDFVFQGTEIIVSHNLKVVDVIS